MSRKWIVSIGIVIFCLIISSTYKMAFLDSNKGRKNTNETETQEIISELVYKGTFPIPVENFIKVTSKFGYRESHGVVHSNHTGIDLCGNTGSKIMVVRDGEVTHSGWQNGYGNCAEIKHIDDEGNIFYTFYAHMRDNSLQVIKGQQVTVGQVLGIQGSTGNSTGDHLHFEVRKSSGTNKDTVDPAPYLFKGEGE